jgi:hypothetical protein
MLRDETHPANRRFTDNKNILKRDVLGSNLNNADSLNRKVEPKVLYVASTDQASTTEWDSAWSGCPYATFYHSRKWFDLWCDYNGELTPEPVVIKFSDGKKAIIPLARKTAYKGIVSTLISSPAGTYGGWISSDVLEVHHACLLVDYLLSRKSIRWRINPVDINSPVFSLTGTATGMSGTGMSNISMDYTHVVDTTVGFDAVEAAISKSNLRSVRRAFRLGIGVFEARSEKEWADYFDIYGDTLKRWGENAASSYRSSLFERIRRIGSPSVQLRLAVYKNRPIAGVLFLKSPTHVSIWHAATRTDSLHLNPFSILAYFALEEACRTGKTWFDFNPSGGHGAVARNKERFGTVKLPCPEIVIKSWFNYCAEPGLKMLSSIVSNIGARRNGENLDAPT